MKRLASLEIQTPEGVTLQLPLAAVLARATAYLIDLFLCWISIIITFLAMIAFSSLVSWDGPIALALVAAFVVPLFYFPFFELKWSGQTPGKRFFSLYVISSDGRPLEADAVIARNFVRVVEVTLPLAIAFGSEQAIGSAPWWMRLPAFAWMLLMTCLPLITKQRLRVGDLIAGTRVVSVPTQKLHETRTESADVFNFRGPQLAHYGEYELETLASLLRSKASVERNRSMLTVAETIATKIDFHVPTALSDPERFLESFYHQQRATLEKKLVEGNRVASKHEANSE